MQLDEKTDRMMKVAVAISEKKKTGKDIDPDDIEILSVDGKKIGENRASRIHFFLNDKIIAASIIGISIIVYGLIGLLNHGWRYENDSSSATIRIFDKKTGSLFMSDGKKFREFSLSDKMVHDYFCDGSGIDWSKAKKK